MKLIERVLAKFGAEDREQYGVIQYCDTMGFPVFHVPNNTYTKFIEVKIRNQLLGVRSGVPDLFVIAYGTLIVIEMKSKKGEATPAQRRWIKLLNAADVPAAICKGKEEAISFIESFKPNPPQTVEEYVATCEAAAMQFVDTLPPPPHPAEPLEGMEVRNLNGDIVQILPLPIDDDDSPF